MFNLFFHYTWLVGDSPSEDKRISEDEIDYIAASINAGGSAANVCMHAVIFSGILHN